MPDARSLVPSAEVYRGRGYGQPFGETDRTDAWWSTPLLQALGLLVLFGYATWAAFQGRYYEVLEGGRNYLSPVYSPKIVVGWWPFSPALLALAAPGGFRATCYYYRKAYYRAFLASPTACAVGKPWKGYSGENAFPLILQNLHRFFMYGALLYMIFLWHDVIKAFTFGGHFGIGVGSLFILASTTMLSFYTFSCHSWRHLIGGSIDCFSCTASTRNRHKI
jgi:hypothetical protein